MTATQRNLTRDAEAALADVLERGNTVGLPDPRAAYVTGGAAFMELASEDNLREWAAVFGARVMPRLNVAHLGYKYADADLPGGVALRMKWQSGERAA